MHATYRTCSSHLAHSALDLFLLNMEPVSQAYTALHKTDKQPALKARLQPFFLETNQGHPDAWQFGSEYLGIKARKR